MAKKIVRRRRASPVKDGWWVVPIDKEPWAYSLLLRGGIVVGGTAGTGNPHFKKRWTPNADVHYTKSMSESIAIEESIRKTRRAAKKRRVVVRRKRK